LINEIRQRAAQSTNKLTNASGNSLANYHVELYQPGVNIVWDQDNAREALRFERRLEMAMEGSRFFDLVRWGIADQVINTYFETEKIRKPNIYKEAVFTKGRD